MAEYYFYSMLFCLFPPVFHYLFRISVKSWLRRKHVSKKQFKSLTMGFRNFCWYESLNNEYHLGILYHINKLIVILYTFLLFLTLTLGWLRYATPLISILYGIISVLIAIMSLFSSFQENISAYGKPFVFLRKTINNGYTSSVLDFVTAAFPLLVGYAHILMMLNVFKTV